MQFRFSTLLPVAALAAVAVAMPSLKARDGSSECTTGTQNCCDNTYTAAELPYSVSSNLPIDLPILDGLVGSGCAVNFGTVCNSQAVCCNGDSFSGNIVIGCSPTNINIF